MSTVDDIVIEWQDNHPFCLECGTFDPENLFGAIPTMFLAYLGIQAGRILGEWPTMISH